MKKKMKEVKKREKGFTLVEIAIVMVIIGILLGAVLKGQELINSSKVKKLQSNYVTGLDALMWSYMDRKGKLPGDCNRDGVIGYDLPTAAPGAGLFSGSTDPVIDYCASTTTTETDPDRVFSDLRQQDFLPRSTPNNQFAITNLFSGTTTVAVGYSTVSAVNYNAVAIYNVPAYVAQTLDVSIDGTENGSLGKIRNGIDTAGAAAWPTNKDTLVNVAYYLDRIP